ncbi:MAG: pyridoxal-5'-phosphate-dependent protein subunit beta [Gammaproteobacteria bacterium SG8_31]|jgi:threonine dehydratase|nr:MAG: pyridoxal-5'-phosphate-dependent protein subunit beta [Gammaproteobacteria bacterium SG8_31]
MTSAAPTIDAVRALRHALGDSIWTTPLMRCAGIEVALDNGTEVWGKLEFLQRTGTFKARGALANLRALSREQLERGVTAVSAGNHAIATAFAARELGSTSKVVMTGSANPYRIKACQSYGGEVVIIEDIHEAFEVARRIEQDEGRYFVHPFEGPAVATGTGTVGLEICDQLDAFDALVVPIGGGGLMGGIASAVRQLRPSAEIIGVEPEGANTMRLSFDAGEPRSIDKVRTIADSLGAPYALPYSFELCRANVDRLVEVTDLELRKAMGFLFQRMKFAVEPACAASTATLVGPLRDELAGKRVVLVFCGSNIDWGTFAEQVIVDD